MAPGGTTLIPADAASTTREIAHSLAAALQRVLADDVSAADLQVARDVAQVLGLGGLDRVLEACHPHAGRPRPAELTPVCERIQRLVAGALESGSIRVFEDADRDLAALAAELQGLEWSESSETLEGRAPAVPTLSLGDVLDDLPLAEPDSAMLRLRLTAPVASALRAALDWLALPGTPVPLRLRSEESTLEIVFEQVNYAGLGPAHKVLSAVGANLGPSIVTGLDPAPTSWVLRVPTFAGRGSWLMVTQGRLRLAIPWHSVLRISLVPASDLQSTLRAAGHPVLEPITPLARSASEYPVALVAHGLKRAYFAADRLVWRLRAQPTLEPSRVMPAEVVSHSIETDDGDVFWAIEPGRLLERLDPPLYEAPRSPVAREESPAVLGPSDVEPVPMTEVADRNETGPLDEQPLPIATRGPAVDLATFLEDTPEEPEMARPEAAPAPRVLVAEDSLTARVYLSRLLEHQGLDVHAVTTASELMGALAGHDWSLLCVDVDLPDAESVTFLSELITMQKRLGKTVPVIGLVRDARDAAVARAAGIVLTLNKPFDRGSVEQMIERLGVRGKER